MGIRTIIYKVYRFCDTMIDPMFPHDTGCSMEVVKQYRFFGIPYKEETLVIDHENIGFTRALDGVIERIRIDTQYHDMDYKVKFLGSFPDELKGEYDAV